MNSRARQDQPRQPAGRTEAAKLHREALRYARAGLRVLPLIGKAPAVRRGLRAATSHPGQIAFTLRRLGTAPTGIGVACGFPLRSGGHLLVLDVDPKHDGDDSLAALEREHGPLPPTWTVRTPSGGWHFYLRTAEPHPTRVGFRPGLELRGAGAYVAAPPSPGYSVEGRGPLAAAPGWLLEAATPPPMHGFPEVPTAGGHSRAYVAAAIAAECERVAQAAVGTRNFTLNRGAFAIGRFVASGIVDADAVESALEAAAALSGIGEGEARRTIRSAFGARANPEVP
jgi:hypothetical protein